MSKFYELHYKGVPYGIETIETTASLTSSVNNNIINGKSTIKASKAPKMIQVYAR
ncbi:MAG: hypothetical protein H0W50_02890 [Parachlamydiaceae bacterium]|nr:hypothetical protein [Parachlamydiaceae bacterium]